jgi:dipeptidyl aminopeptidase/acylaminoacyl peptidase
MVLLDDRLQMPIAAIDDAQALFEEARRRTHRRRLRGAIAVGVVLAVAGAVLALRGSAGAGTVAETGSQPFVNMRAFSHEGELAFVSKGRLWVLDGPTGTLTPLTRPSRQASDPQFSPDGRWLVYGVFASSATGVGRTWLAHADGASPRLIASGDYTASWLSGGQLLVGGRLWRVTSSETLTPVGSTSAGLFPPTADTHEYIFQSSTMRVTAPTSSRGVVRLEVSSSLAGRRTTWFQARVSFTKQSGLHGTFFFFATALPGDQGILVGSSPFCCDVSDGVDLYEIRAAGAQPKNLGVTVGDTISAGANGTFAFTLGANRYAWVTKAVVICSAATERCSPVPTPAGTLSLDPAFSPNGQTLAFVEAASMRAGNIGQAVVRGWYATHSLWLMRHPGATPTEIAGTAGAASPVWSADGGSMLYVSNDALWLLPTLSSKPVLIASPLFTPSGWQSDFGEVDWTGQFAWSSAAAS